MTIDEVVKGLKQMVKRAEIDREFSVPIYINKNKQQALSLAIQVLSRCNEEFIMNELEPMLESHEIDGDIHLANEMLTWNSLSKHYAQSILAALTKENEVAK